jgi:CheY-like chemotaxis protein
MESHVEIVVSDSGVGISKEFLPYVFDRFRQADASTTRIHGGLGLGLSIVRQLVDLHGGSVSVYSEGEDKGATFTITLPFVGVISNEKEAEPVQSTQSEGVLSFEGLPSLQGLKVLVVDDEADTRTLVKRVMESNKATVFTADSAAAGLEALRRERPQVLLCDIGMPGEDGYQLLEKIRALPESEGGSTPAVALTAFARSEDRRRALMAGFQLHVPKPVEPAELLAVVANLSGASRRANAR